MGLTLTAIACAFVTLLAVGVVEPCMELHLDMDLLYRENPDLRKMSAIIDTLGLDELMHEKVSIGQSLKYAGTWALEGEVNSGYAVVMVGIFMLLLPCVDMVLLIAAACTSSGGRRRDGAAGGDLAQKIVVISKAVNKLSMLDVAVMGILVVVLSMSTMRSKGVVLDMSPGLYALFGAELCHYVAAWLVHRQCTEVSLPAPEGAAGCGEAAARTHDEAAGPVPKEEEEQDNEVSTTEGSIDSSSTVDDSEV